MTTPAFPIPPSHIALKMYGDDIYVIHCNNTRVGFIKYKNQHNRKFAITSIEVWTDDVFLLRYVAEVIDYLNGLAS